MLSVNSQPTDAQGHKLLGAVTVSVQCTRALRERLQYGHALFGVSKVAWCPIFTMEGLRRRPRVAPLRRRPRDAGANRQRFLQDDFVSCRPGKRQLAACTSCRAQSGVVNLVRPLFEPLIHLHVLLRARNVRGNLIQQPWVGFKLFQINLSLLHRT